MPRSTKVQFRRRRDAVRWMRSQGIEGMFVFNTDDSGAYYGLLIGSQIRDVMDDLRQYDSFPEIRVYEKDPDDRFRRLTAPEITIYSDAWRAANP